MILTRQHEQLENKCNKCNLNVMEKPNLGVLGWLMEKYENVL